MCYRTIFVDRFNAVSLNFLKMRNQVRAHWFILHHEHLKVVKFIRSISVNGGLWCRETQLTFFAFFKSLSLSLSAPPPHSSFIHYSTSSSCMYTYFQEKIWYTCIKNTCKLNWKIKLSPPNMVNQTEVNLSTCHQDRWHDGLFSTYNIRLFISTPTTPLKNEPRRQFITGEKTWCDERSLNVDQKLLRKHLIKKMYIDELKDSSS